ncbi:MAG: Crp/Fnr family transcriptional regulator [Acidobacteriaceae bacterium]
MQSPNAMEQNRNHSASGAGDFCKQLSADASKEFENLECVSTYHENAVLFMEKQTPRGVHVVLEGQVKLSISSSEGKRLILRIAKAGEVLGLASVLSDREYEMTAETLHTCRIAYVRREDFLQFLAKYPAAYQSVIQALSSSYTEACEQLRTVGLSSSVPERLARLLLEWSATGQQTENGTRIKISLTHEEIGEFIGTSRETVTRTLSDFKHKRLAALQGSTLMIPSRMALESYARVS